MQIEAAAQPVVLEHARALTSHELYSAADTQLSQARRCRAGAFQQKVTLLCSHSFTTGAYGLWLNKPLDVTLADTPSGSDSTLYENKPRRPGQVAAASPSRAAQAGSGSKQSVLQ